jgi:hypothetical protein
MVKKCLTPGRPSSIPMNKCFGACFSMALQFKILKFALFDRVLRVDHDGYFILFFTNVLNLLLIFLILQIR